MKPHRTMPAKYTAYHPVVFVLTFSSYALFHATRKTFSNVKETISEEWTPTFHNKSIQKTMPDWIWNKHCMFETKDEVKPYLGVLDAVFMISYAVGLYISGMLGDRFNMRYVLSIGMCSSAVMVFIFGVVFEWAHYYNKYMYVFLWILNGLLQSTGWPTVVAVMGNWFGRSSRGLILGLWSACASVGNIIGAFMVSSVLDYGYQYAFLLTSSALFAGGVINFFGLLSSPKEVGLPMPDEENTVIQRDYTINDRESGVNGSMYIELQADSARDPLLGDNDSDSEIIISPVTRSEERPKALSFCDALCLPGVALYALAYACLKLVNYSFFFWLPYYLTNKYGWKQTVADDISVWYDVGGIIGGTIFGFVSDRFQKRSIIVIPMLLLGIPSLFIYNSSLSSTKVMNSVLMSIVGFFIGGVANLVSAAISADLGRQGPVQGNAEALATVTGIVDGTGSVGAAIGQILVPVIEDGLGWKSVFYLFMIMTFLTALCIVPLFIREVRDMTASCSYSWFQGFHKRSSNLVIPADAAEDPSDNNEDFQTANDEIANQNTR